jgi:hypothetical protein
MADIRPENERTSIEWGTWFQWVLATTVGWVAGWVLAGEVGIGIGVGITQWLVLRQLVRQAGWWIWASTVGWFMGWALVVTGIILPAGSGEGLTSVIAGAVLGAAMGIAQWLVLRRLVYQAGWWVFASTIAWTVALTGLLGRTVVGTVAGALTGFMLDWLLRYPRPDQTK